MRRVIVDIYDGNETTPILSHIAHGATTAEALDILATHRQFDAFLDAGLSRRLEPGVYAGTFKGIPLRTLVREE